MIEKYNPPPCPSQEGTLLFSFNVGAACIKSPLGRGTGVGFPLFGKERLGEIF